MNLPAFESLLKEAIGLDAASIGSSAVERAVIVRAKVCDAGDAEAYLRRLGTSPSELAELIDAVVVPETWFFRDRGAFAALAYSVREERASGPLRVLSFPCATGEEPYSIAMTLVDAGLPTERFRIDAVDVSPRLIVRAAAAVYGKNSFRGVDLSFRSRYFARETDCYRLTETIRRAVNFRIGNLLHPGLIGDGAPYDVVFCRNLLIYFDAATQDQVLATLARLVRDGGLLFVGPSEASLVRGRGFEPVKAPLAFAFRKRLAAALHAVKPIRVHDQGPRARQALKMRRPVGRRADTVDKRLLPLEDGSAAAKPPAAGSGMRLAEIERLANSGHLAEAARLCDAHLSEAGASADALVLLALIRDAAGNAAEAIELYRKALYLEPHHEAALLHLKLRLEQEGDAAGAKRLNERMRRIADGRAK